MIAAGICQNNKTNRFHPVFFDHWSKLRSVEPKNYRDQQGIRILSNGFHKEGFATQAEAAEWLLNREEIREAGVPIDTNYVLIWVDNETGPFLEAYLYNKKLTRVEI